MGKLFILIFLIFHPSVVSALSYQEIISQSYPDLVIVEKEEFDEKMFNEQLPPDQIKSLGGVYGVAVDDFDRNGLKDFVALTHEVVVKREKVGPYDLPQLWMVICLQNTEYTCSKIRKYLLGEPIQSYLSASRLTRDYKCEGTIYKSGTPAYYLMPALGNILEWSVYDNGKVVSCLEGD